MKASRTTYLTGSLVLNVCLAAVLAAVLLSEPATEPVVPEETAEAVPGTGDAVQVDHAMVERYIADEKARNNGCLHLWGGSPPTVRITENTVPALRTDIREAVGIVNGALPETWQLGLVGAPASFDDAVAGVPGEIIVTILPQLGRWPHKRELHSAGRAVVKRHVHDPCAIESASVWVDHEHQSRQERMNVLVHQLLHALGRGHADEGTFPASIMGPYAVGLPEAVLHPFDQALLGEVHKNP